MPVMAMRSLLFGAVAEELLLEWCSGLFHTEFLKLDRFALAVVEFLELVGKLAGVVGQRK